MGKEYVIPHIYNVEIVQLQKILGTKKKGRALIVEALEKLGVSVEELISLK